MSQLINELIKLNQSTQEDPYGKILTFSEDKVKKLALDEAGQVLYISNESFEATYANKDLTTFLTIIVRFNMMIEDYLDANPEGDFFEDVVNEEMIEEFADYIEELDENAVGNDTFWDELLECVLDC